MNHRSACRHTGQGAVSRTRCELPFKLALLHMTAACSRRALLVPGYAHLGVATAGAVPALPSSMPCRHDRAKTWKAAGANRMLSSLLMAAQCACHPVIPADPAGCTPT